MILFLADYPQGEVVKEGMSQRILNIDSFHSDYERVYLCVSPFRYKRLRKQKISDKITLYHCNSIIHFFTIIRLFRKASKVYIHSVYNVLPSFPYISSINNKYILDLHGVVPEENALVGLKFRSSVFNKCEQLIFSKSNTTIITVTDSMREHFEKKYTGNKVKFIKYIIFPNNLKQYVGGVAAIDNKVHIVYSGNLQKWQNIDLMLDTMENMMRNKNYVFHLLTGESEELNRLVLERIGHSERISIRSLHPSQLGEVYSQCHYGFVLRDDIIVNNVACPTKIIEYMNYGIVPIVLNDNIGDFKSYGYERVTVDCVNNLVPKKSTLNVDIIQRMKSENVLVDIRNL
ncbi:hypothetical protein [Sphingobacterium multivorum]|uniref:hypothetical protein n=1 Tax=Sphingobacterium multivorum TaxID=28454 RepID=UPI003DA46866